MPSKKTAALSRSFSSLSILLSLSFARLLRPALTCSIRSQCVFQCALEISRSVYVCGPLQQKHAHIIVYVYNIGIELEYFSIVFINLTTFAAFVLFTFVMCLRLPFGAHISLLISTTESATRCYAVFSFFSLYIILHSISPFLSLPLSRALFSRNICRQLAFLPCGIVRQVIQSHKDS